MAKPKFQKINELIVMKGSGINKIASALYISAKGSKHFYESMELLSEVLPEAYKEEFEQLNKQ
ncbi:hypothetical protein EZY14_002830 [Kordia sp. TARA_039_SRF]|nr:hypothetical protein EZY14_002830 [Kordia sp. TARA_039_SRF]